MSYQSRKKDLLKTIAELSAGDVFSIGSVGNGAFAREAQLGRYLVEHQWQLSIKVIGDFYGSNLYEKI